MQMSKMGVFFIPLVWVAGDNSERGKEEAVWKKSVWLYRILLQSSLDLLDDLDRTAVHLIHMDTLTSPSMPYLSEDLVIYLGLD